MQQRSLFPDGFEVQEQALAALRDLRIEKALACVRRARALGTALVGLNELDAALQWLAARVGRDGDVDAAVRACSELPSAVANGLGTAAAAVVELGLASFLAPRLGGQVGFLDREQQVSAARILLLSGNVRAAREASTELLGAGHADHAGLWFDHANACWLDQRPEEANASYVRALLLDPFDGNAFYRCACAPLRELWQRLSGTMANQEAVAEMLLTEAWLSGILGIKPGNSWLSRPQRERVRERSAAAPGWRFSLLLYLDRSAPAGACDVDSREDMALLLPDQFARFVGAVARRQG